MSVLPPTSPVSAQRAGLRALTYPVSATAVIAMEGWLDSASAPLRSTAR